MCLILMRMGSAQGNGLQQSDDYYQESKMQLGFFSTLHSGGPLSDYMITWKLQNDYLAYLFYTNPYPDPFAGDYSRVCNHVLPPLSPL